MIHTIRLNILYIQPVHWSYINLTFNMIPCQYILLP